VSATHRDKEMAMRTVARLGALLIAAAFVSLL